MTKPGPVRNQKDLADVVEMVLDKGIVINADIVVTINETELLGVQIRAAIASFETAAEYGLEFPSGTDMRRVEEAAGRDPLEGGVDLGIEAQNRGRTPPGKRPDPTAPLATIGGSDEEETESEGEAAESDEGDSESEGEATESDEDAMVSDEDATESDDQSTDGGEESDS